MLGKLIKNEFKANLHSIGMIYVVAIVAVGLMALAYLAKVTWISALATIVLIAAGAIAIIVTFFCVVLNYQKTLFGNQGYLSFTLPVTSGQLLAAKTITSFCWMLLSYVVAIAIFIGVYLYATAMVGDDVKAAFELLRVFVEGIPSGATIKKVVILAALVVFIRIVLLIAQLYFAITLSNTRIMQKFGGFSTVIIFFVIFIFMSVVSLLLTQYVPLSLVVTSTGLYYSTAVSMSEPVAMSFGLVGTLFNLVGCAVLFFLTATLMNTKVNIK